MFTCDCCARKKFRWFYLWFSMNAIIWLAYIAARISPLGRNWGTCPYVQTDPDFFTNLYVGRWYEFGRSESVPKDWERGECQTAFYE